MLRVIRTGIPFTFRMPSLQPVYVKELRRFALKHSFNSHPFDHNLSTSRRLLGLLELIRRAYTFGTFITKRHIRYSDSHLFSSDSIVVYVYIYIYYIDIIYVFPLEKIYTYIFIYLFCYIVLQKFCFGCESCISYVQL